MTVAHKIFGYLITASYVLFATALPAAVYFVSPTGDDGASGSIEHPFATVGRAQDAASAGDTVFIRGGTYYVGSNTVTGVEISKSGIAGKPLRIWGYENERPIFDGSGIRGRGRLSGWKITGSHVHVKGLVVRNVPAPWGTSYGVWVLGTHHNILERLVLHDHGGPGLFIDGGTGGHLVLNCDSYNNYDPNSRTGPGQNADGFGCHYQEPGPSTLFRGCRAWWNSDDGFDWFKQEVPVIIENCWAMGAGYLPNGEALARSGNGAGFKMGNTFTGVRHTIRNCVAIKNKAQGFYANHSHGGSDWFNNTSFANRGAAFDMLSDIVLTGTNVHKLRNNVALPAKITNVGNSDVRHNSWDLGIAVSEQDFLSLSDEGFLGPRQVNGDLPELRVLKPRQGSQLIDRGVDVGLPYLGAAPDLGAYEVGEATSARSKTSTAAVVEPATMQRIYEEVKTPFKYGIVLRGEANELVDCPTIMRQGDHWYMMYVAISNKVGYETFLARSEDLLQWEKLGKVLSFPRTGWDAWQVDGGWALVNPEWEGDHQLEKFDGKYWLSYLGGAGQGYEPDPLSIGMAWSLLPTEAREWNRIPFNPVLGPRDADVREFESVTLYKSQIIRDPTESLGAPFVMFYNGKLKSGYEKIGMAVSRDMVNWKRFGTHPVVANGEVKQHGISGDPQIVRLKDVWVMFYFGAFWKPKAFDTFAASHDLVHWTKWEGPHLVEPSEPWDATYAHKPWVLKHAGVVYHFYCAVGDQGRVIALATSKDLRTQPLKR